MLRWLPLTCATAKPTLPRALTNVAPGTAGILGTQAQATRYRAASRAVSAHKVLSFSLRNLKKVMADHRSRSTERSVSHTLRDRGRTGNASAEAAEAILPAQLSTLLTFSSRHELLPRGACQPKGSPTMQVTLIRPSELGRSEAEQWRAFQGSSQLMSHPFLSLSYARTWETATPSARVAVVEDNGQIQAFIPFELGAGKIAGPLGGAHTALDGMVTSGVPLNMPAVVRKAGLRGWRFEHVPVDLKALDPHRYSGPNHCRTVSYVDLSGGYDKYLSDLSDGTRKRIARTEAYRRALHRKVGSVSFEWRVPKPEYFDQLMEWKSAQYRNAREMSEHQEVMSVLRELSLMDTDDCRGLIGVLFAGEQTAAVTLCLEAPGIITLYTLAYNPEFARFSAGTMQLLDLIRDSAARDITMVDFGADHTVQEHTYKDRFRNATYELSGGAVWASKIEAKARSIYRSAKYRS